MIERVELRLVAEISRGVGAGGGEDIDRIADLLKGGLLPIGNLECPVGFLPCYQLVLKGVADLTSSGLVGSTKVRNTKIT